MAKRVQTCARLGAPTRRHPPIERRYPMTTAGQWPWKPASAKECVIAHQPNGVALKMDEVESTEAIPGRVPNVAEFLAGGRSPPMRYHGRLTSRSDTPGRAEAGRCRPVDRPGQQILVVVASIRMRPLEGRSGAGFLNNSS